MRNVGIFIVYNTHKGEKKKKKKKELIIVNNFKPLTELGGVSSKCTGGCKVCMYISVYPYIHTYICI